MKKETQKLKRLLTRTDIEDLRDYAFKLEKFLFVSSFLIRKLIESLKISDELEAENFKVEEADVKDFDATCDFLSKHQFLSNYEIHTRSKIALPISEISNIFIHSYIFCLSTYERSHQDKSQIETFEIIVTSDRRKNKLYFIKLRTFLDICEKVYSDDIVYEKIGIRNGSKYRSPIIKSRLPHKDLD